MINPKS